MPLHNAIATDSEKLDESSDGERKRGMPHFVYFGQSNPSPWVREHSQKKMSPLHFGSYPDRSPHLKYELDAQNASYQ
jgi:hypothetical protein